MDNITNNKAQVTAQDFLDAMFPVSTSKERFEKLLSRACYNAFIFGRKDGLRDMDEAYEAMDYAWDTKNTKEYKAESDYIEKLRQEYSATK